MSLESDAYDHYIGADEGEDERERCKHGVLIDDACEACADNYDGPPDGDAWSGGFAANH